MCVHIHWLLPLAGFTLRGWYLLTSSLHHVQWKRCSFPYNLIPLSMWMNKLHHTAHHSKYYYQCKRIFYTVVWFFFFVFRFFCIHFDSFTFFVKNSFNFFFVLFCFQNIQLFFWFLFWIPSSELSSWNFMTRQMGVNTHRKWKISCMRTSNKGF